MTEWFGLPVEEYQTGAKPGAVIHRLGFSYDDESFTTEVLEAYLALPEAPAMKAIVLGMPGDAGASFDEAIQALVAGAPRLTALRGIFLGDILQEENEMSWIEQGDVGLILAAFPNLEELRVRGGAHLLLTPCTNAGLKKLVIETGGLPAAVLQQISASSFPNLEHLEVWLGTDEYGWNGSLDDVMRLLEPGQFPKLKYLGLRNSEIADEIAPAVANDPLLDQLEELDLSGGTLSDAGAEALIASPRVRKLAKLNLYRNYLTDATLPRLAALGPRVDVGGQEEPDDWDGEPHYYVAVGE
ncbi:MAG: hypothetical protein JWO82_3860 [Akkermansiaceae bacterium]|nr:hypothetical protein [Akkermansiaceae bacterium]